MEGASESHAVGSPAANSAPPGGRGSRGSGPGNRGRGRGGNQRNRGGGNNNRRAGNQPTVNSKSQQRSPDGAEEPTPANPAAQKIAAEARPQALQDEEIPDDADVCFICANVVAHHSIAPCNHTTCHICGLRMRALYKDKNCAHCRVWNAPREEYVAGHLLTCIPSDASSIRHLRL